VGLRTAAAGSVTGIQETSIRALAKLEQVLPSRLRNRVNALQAATVEIPAPGPAVVVEAVDEHTCVIDVGSDTPQMLALYLGMLDVDFDVEDPELVEQLRTLADRYRRVITTTGPFSSG
jgi:hypothetical protein